MPRADPDATRVVARRGVSAGAGARAAGIASGSEAEPDREPDPDPDPHPGAAADPEPEADPDATRVAARPALDPIRRTHRPTAPRGGTTSSRNPAPPVAEPEDVQSSRELAALMFKPALDPKRRARESPFAADPATAPRQGVARGIPVVYGARSELGVPMGVAASPVAPDARAVSAVPAADREGLPSTARLNRRDRRATLVGGAALLIIAGAGLWWIGALALG